MSEVRIRNRRGTASEWTSANPTLGIGERGIETDTGLEKIGDGTTAWNSLSYTTVSNIKTSDESTNASFYPVFVSNTGDVQPKIKLSSSAFSFNPSTSTLTAGTFSGNLTGNASNITATSNTSLTSLSNLSTVGTITTGTWNATAISVVRGGTGQTSYTNGQLLIGNSTDNALTKATLTAGTGISITNGAGSISIAATNNGTVTSVTATSPVVSSGGTAPVISLSTAYGDTLNPYGSKTTKTFLAAPNATNGTPSFRAIVASDVPTLNQNTTGTAANVTGTVAIANGGTGATTAANARTNLGATTIGSNLFTLTNPGAIRFPRFNADNTVTSRTAAEFRTDIGAGTVTSVSGTGTVSGISLSGTVTTSGNLTLGGALSVLLGDIKDAGSGDGTGRLVVATSSGANTIPGPSAIGQVLKAKTAGLTPEYEWGEVTTGVTSVSAGDGLSGGGTGAVNLSVVAYQGLVPNRGKTALEITSGTQKALAVVLGTGSDEAMPGNTPIPQGTVTSVGSGTGLTGGPITTSGTLALTGQALALHNLGTNGLIARTSAGNVAGRTLTAGTGISISNGDGVSGNPTITALNNGTVTSIATNNGITGGTITSTGTLGLTGQALALHNLGTNGLIARTSAGNVAGRTLTAGTGISISNGNGVSGDPTIAVEGDIGRVIVQGSTPSGTPARAGDIVFVV